MKNDMINIPGISHANFRAYLIGFILSIVLTIIPFGLVYYGHGSLSEYDILVSIAIAAVIQVFVQLHYFLHLDRSSDQSWNVLALLFTLLIIAIILAGALWIMIDLHSRMM
ncbi:MAG: cytochrome o ubiquinol oxidase subunit IV [Proteobacteria bacterium]|nr:cytochrome o ubiquinol oxidase subunit IV [Pseudomonadota bacterium]